MEVHYADSFNRNGDNVVTVYGRSDSIKLINKVN
jgi:hypothetical protein